MAMQLDGRRAEINITPLIDVLLVLLIIFMVITPEMSHGLGAVAPQQADHNTASGSDAVVLTVEGDGTVRLNQETVALANLGARLRNVFASNPSQPVFVRAKKGLDFEQVAQAIDIAKGAGLQSVALMTR